MNLDAVCNFFFLIQFSNPDVRKCDKKKYIYFCNVFNVIITLLK